MQHSEDSSIDSELNLVNIAVTTLAGGAQSKIKEPSLSESAAETRLCQTSPQSNLSNVEGPKLNEKARSYDFNSLLMGMGELNEDPNNPILPVHI